MKLSPASLEHLHTYESFLESCYQDGLIKYKEALSEPIKYLNDVVSNQGHTATYFCIHNEEIVGAIRFRHHTSQYIEDVIGHVGYETKPSARGKGIAQIMLSWIQKNILESDAIITCEFDNIASEKVITRCGGVYLNQIFSKEKQNEVRRYSLPAT